MTAGCGRGSGKISRSKMVSRIVWFLPWLCACGALPGFVPGHTFGVRHGPLRAAESSPAVCAAAGGASAEYCSFPARADGARIDAYWYRPQAARMDSDSAAVLVFTDVYGVRDDHNRAWIGAFAEASGLPVFAPDLFRGVPWNESKFGGDTSSPQYEAWRSEHYVPGRVLCDMRMQRSLHSAACVQANRSSPQWASALAAGVSSRQSLVTPPARTVYGLG